MRGRTALLVTAFVLCAAAACVAAKGGEGQPCKCEGCSFLSGRFFCDDGLVCNQTAAEYTCQRPNSVGVGGACNAWEQVDAGAPVLCAEGLSCWYSGRVDASSPGVVPCHDPWCCEPLPPPCADCKDAGGSEGHS